MLAEDGSIAASRSPLVTATQLGGHLGITRQRIAALTEVEHVIERLPDGRFDQDACRLRYLNWLRDPARRGARSEAEAALQKQKSTWLALKIARYEREHITMEEHNHFVDTITSLFLTALGSLPAMMGGNDLTIRRKWEAFVDDLCRARGRSSSSSRRGRAQ
jgi:hypothetical protein